MANHSAAFLINVKIQLLRASEFAGSKITTHANVEALRYRTSSEKFQDLSWFFGTELEQAYYLTSTVF